MAKVLVVKPIFPYPPSQGTRRVSLALLRDLATEHEVVYLCQLEDRSERSLIPHLTNLGVRVVAPLMPNHTSLPHKVLYKVRNRLLSRMTHRPELCFYWANRALRSNLERLGTEFEPDLTILENWETYGLRRSIRGGVAALLAHDAVFQMLERAVEVCDDPAEKARRRQRLVHEKRIEIQSWTLFDGILTLTEDDCRTIPIALEGAGQVDPLVRTMPVPVPDEFFTYGRPAAPGKRIGFFGTFRSDFNRDALTFLLREIWPRVVERIPEAELVIAGNGFSGPLRAEAERCGARWLGYVADLGGYFGSVDLLIVPLRFGAGVRIRILEALAAGVPVVATPIAAAGLGTEEGRHVLLGADAVALAAECESILAQPARAADLSRQGRTWCMEHHGPDVLRPRRLAAVREILEGGRVRQDRPKGRRVDERS